MSTISGCVGRFARASRYRCSATREPPSPLHSSYLSKANRLSYNDLSEDVTQSTQLDSLTPPSSTRTFVRRTRPADPFVTPSRAVLQPCPLPPHIPRYVSGALYGIHVQRYPVTPPAVNRPARVPRSELRRAILLRGPTASVLGPPIAYCRARDATTPCPAGLSVCASMVANGALQSAKPRPKGKAFWLAKPRPKAKAFWLAKPKSENMQFVPGSYGPIKFSPRVLPRTLPPPLSYEAYLDRQIQERIQRQRVVKVFSTREEVERRRREIRASRFPAPSTPQHRVRQPGCPFTGEDPERPGRHIASPLTGQSRAWNSDDSDFYINNSWWSSSDEATRENTSVLVPFWRQRLSAAVPAPNPAAASTPKHRVRQPGCPFTGEDPERPGRHVASPFTGESRAWNSDDSDFYIGNSWWASSDEDDRRGDFTSFRCEPASLVRYSESPSPAPEPGFFRRCWNWVKSWFE